MKIFGRSKENSETNKNTLSELTLKVSLEGMPQKTTNHLALELHQLITVNPLAIEAMNEVGIDISKQRPKIITEDMIRQSTHRVNMGCLDKNSCPTLFLHNVIDWDIEDPKGKPIQKVREIESIP